MPDPAGSEGEGKMIGRGLLRREGGRREGETKRPALFGQIAGLPNLSRQTFEFTGKVGLPYPGFIGFPPGQSRSLRGR